VKVIASSLRKGNIVDLDGRLYVILTAENIHPGKGTPVTQVDMRRLSDGVKASQRYKTTDQVERAHVEEREFQFLYEDGDGFNFMNMDSYDQIAVGEDVNSRRPVFGDPSSGSPRVLAYGSDGGNTDGRSNHGVFTPKGLAPRPRISMVRVRNQHRARPAAARRGPPGPRPIGDHP